MIFNYFPYLFLGCFDPMIFSRGPYFDCPAQARLITPSVVSERLKVNGSVARQAIRHLEDRAGPSPWDPEVPGKDNHEAGLEMTWDFRATFWMGHDGPKMSSILPFCWWISGAKGEGHDRACRREVPWLNSNIDHAPTMLSFCLTWEPPFDCWNGSNKHRISGLFFGSALAFGTSKF